MDTLVSPCAERRAHVALCGPATEPSSLLTQHRLQGKDFDHQEQHLQDQGFEAPSCYDQAHSQCSEANGAKACNEGHQTQKGQSTRGQRSDQILGCLEMAVSWAQIPLPSCEIGFCRYSSQQGHSLQSCLPAPGHF